ncbi:MAG: 16S rRNA (cytosine(1402)-N(4))-methyltransferase RsmH [Firmicutes bacterium]|nr:16S rRNA (cytosine(1402)-N(4))-methyltransferase RsmH [Bacillota bacterium]
MAPRHEKYYHAPVMPEEVLECLKPAPGKIMVDATLGGGGHSEAILERLLPGGKLIGIDQDDDALRAAQARLSRFGEAFKPVKGNFRHVASIIKEFGLKNVDGLLFDLGVSSYQLDSPGRGFSYRGDVFLDMRMDQSLPLTAADLLRDLSKRQLTGIFRKYGEEKWAARIASFIVEYRQKKEPISRSKQLVQIIKNSIPAAARRRGGHPAKRIFQALRIAVNSELENLKKGLEQGIDILQARGRIVVIAYQSLEDVLVKKQFRESSRGCICPPGIPVCRCNNVPVLKILTRKPLYAAPKELSKNPRAKSARLRAAEKLA